MSLPVPYWKEKLYRKPVVAAPSGHLINTQNLWERAACEKLWKEGWKVYRRGWPDFVAVRGDEIQFIEVKPPRNRHHSAHGLDPDQMRLAGLLKKHFGICIQVWNEYSHFGVEEIKGPAQVRQPRKKKYKSLYGEHLIKPRKAVNSLTETVPTQG